MSTEGRAVDRAVSALLTALHERGEGIRRAEMARARRRMGVLTPAQDHEIEAATAAIVNRLLHTPTVRLEEMARSGYSDEQATLVRRVLGLA